MEMRSLLVYLVTCILILPCYIILFLMIRPALQLAMPFLQLMAAAHYAWPPDSQFAGQCSVPSDWLMPWYDTLLGVSQYKEEVERVECVFCLSDIEGGEEIRELGCRHLFHRVCLDGWLESGRATCPLCRVAMVPLGAKAKIAEVNG